MNSYSDKKTSVLVIPLSKTSDFATGQKRPSVYLFAKKQSYGGTQD